MYLLVPMQLQLMVVSDHGVLTLTVSRLVSKALDKDFDLVAFLELMYVNTQTGHKEILYRCVRSNFDDHIVVVVAETCNTRVWRKATT